MTESMQTPAQSNNFEFAALAEARNYRRALLREFAPYLRGQVLEVGAGIGQMTAELLRLPGIEGLSSVEPEEDYCAYMRQRFPGHSLHHGTVASLRVERHWNSIVNINVLEHIENDEEELAAYFQLLRPTRGTLCLFVPARPEIYAPIDRDFGHFRRYTRPELRRKLRAAGFNLLHLRYCNSIGYFAWWMTFCLLKKRTFNPASVRLFDRAIFPIVHGFESRICPPPFGQSLLSVAQAIDR